MRTWRPLWRSWMIAALLAIPLGMARPANAQISVAIGIGPVVGYPAPVAVYGPPSCEWGYYPYYPYACVPYGYYGPDWFSDGVFIGAGPWFQGWYGRPWGWGYNRIGFYGWGGWYDHDGWYDRGGWRDGDAWRDRGGWRGGEGWRGRGDRGYYGGGYDHRGYAGGPARLQGGYHGMNGFQHGVRPAPYGGPVNAYRGGYNGFHTVGRPVYGGHPVQGFRGSNFGGGFHGRPAFGGGGLPWRTGLWRRVSWRWRVPRWWRLSWWRLPWRWRRFSRWRIPRWRTSLIIRLNEIAPAFAGAFLLSGITSAGDLANHARDLFGGVGMGQGARLV